MSKVFRKTAIIAIAVVMLFGTLAIVAGCGEFNTAPIRRIEQLTGVTLPDDAVILYHHIDRGFVNGRRAQYTVFGFEEKPADFLLENNFRGHEEWTTFGSPSPSIIYQYRTLNIPSKFLPVWEDEFLWHMTQNVYFIYFIEQQILTVYVVGS